ncbi:hypothetical protein DL96DRAFT_346388 [Flagelloscypha sp. PMI_526]|nr:hypothetical protein DL96DRAFT_346388 [Flagelloscypha sp. PMI_526]
MMSTKSKSEQYTEKMKLRQRKKNRNTIEVDDDEDGAVWVGYRKLADKYDQDMISGFKHTIDGLLILAGLFSTIVATFLTQTYQSLKPNPAALSLILQFEQIEIMRAGAGNSSSVPSSAVTKDTTTFTQIDLWVNGLLFTSLALSVVSAFLGGLVRQWLQVSCVAT